ncbi:MAG: GNAT family N-acetyltransferase [Alphaproteobacteria bacterium]|nr:GNAT family N-acetyltransferase [Alphaproteobacteria bacterium]
MPVNSPYSIVWNKASKSEWDKLLVRCRRPNLLLMWPYAMALAKTKGKKTRFGVIHFDGNPVGAITEEQAAKFGPVKVLTCNRGPVFKDDLPDSMASLFLHFMRREYMAWKGRFFSFLPEFPDSEAMRALMKSNGWYRKGEGYRTAWLDLTLEGETLRGNLRANWRGALQKAEKTDLIVQHDSTGRYLDWLLSVYEDDKIERGFIGPAPALIRAYDEVSKSVGRLHRVHLWRCVKDSVPVAGILVVRHLTTATYLVGWTSEEGRAVNAHHLLLWRAALALKKDDVTALDLGGYNEEEAAGIANFKRGLGGEEWIGVGQYA